MVFSGDRGRPPLGAARRTALTCGHASEAVADRPHRRRAREAWRDLHRGVEASPSSPLRCREVTEAATCCFVSAAVDCLMSRCGRQNPGRGSLRGTQHPLPRRPCESPLALPMPACGLGTRCRMWPSGIVSMGDGVFDERGSRCASTLWDSCGALGGGRAARRGSKCQAKSRVRTFHSASHPWYKHPCHAPRSNASRWAPLRPAICPLPAALVHHLASCHGETSLAPCTSTTCSSSSRFPMVAGHGISSIRAHIVMSRHRRLFFFGVRFRRVV